MSMRRLMCECGDATEGRIGRVGRWVRLAAPAARLHCTVAAHISLSCMHACLYADHEQHGCFVVVVAGRGGWVRCSGFVTAMQQRRQRELAAVWPLILSTRLSHGHAPCASPIQSNRRGGRRRNARSDTWARMHANDCEQGHHDGQWTTDNGGWMLLFDSFSIHPPTRIPPFAVIFSFSTIPCRHNHAHCG